MELLYRFEGRLAEPTPIGQTADGIRIDFTFEGRVADGTLAGGRAWGADYVRIRPDDVGIVDAHDILEVPGGHVHARAHGYTLPPEAGAGHERRAIHGYALLETGVPQYADLNRAVVKIDGWVDQASGELVFEGRRVPAAEVPAPDTAAHAVA